MIMASKGEGGNRERERERERENIQVSTLGQCTIDDFNLVAVKIKIQLPVDCHGASASKYVENTWDEKSKTENVIRC
jgi:hypothetical protein